MSESAILTIVASIVTAFVTVATMVVGLFTLWIKLKYEKRTSTETILKGQQETQEQVKQVVAQAQDSLNENVRINTEVTKAGIKVAARDNSAAVVAATDAKAVAEVVAKKLNGGLDHAIEKAVDPIKVTLQEHQMVITELMEEHAKNMAEVQKQFREISDYIHRRNQEILDKFSTTAYGVQAILEMLKADREGRKHTETRVD